MPPWYSTVPNPTHQPHVALLRPSPESHWTPIPAALHHPAATLPYIVLIHMWLESGKQNNNSPPTYAAAATLRLHCIAVVRHNRTYITRTHANTRRQTQLACAHMCVEYMYVLFVHLDENTRQAETAPHKHTHTHQFTMGVLRSHAVLCDK